jgi:hypothetical protein
MRVEMVQKSQLGSYGARFSATTAANGYAGLSLLSAQLPSNYLPQSVLPNEPFTQPLTPISPPTPSPFPSQLTATPAAASVPFMTPYSQVQPMSAPPGFSPYVPPGYVPILAPVSLLQQLSDPSTDHFDRHAGGDLEVPISSTSRHEKGDSAAFSTSRNVSDDQQASDPTDKAADQEALEEQDRASLRRHKRSEPLLRRVRRWAGAAFVVAATTTSVMAGASFGWRRQQFLVPSILKRLPMFAQRSVSTMNGGVLAGGIGFLVADAFRGALGLNPRRLHYHTLDADLDGTY